MCGGGGGGGGGGCGGGGGGGMGMNIGQDVGDIFGAAGAKDQTQNAYNRGIDTMRFASDENKRLLDPYSSSGLTGLAGMQSLLKDPSSITKTPWYQFQLSEGLRGLTQQKGAMGKAFSGEFVRGASEFQRGLFSTSWKDLYGAYQGLAGLGAGAAEAQARNSLGLSEDIASMYVGQGNAQAKAGYQEWDAIGRTADDIGKMIAASDRRLKTDIQLLGYIRNIPIYKFKYKWNTDITHIGVMADEIEMILPHAIHIMKNGYKAVDYAIVNEYCSSGDV